MPLKSFLFTGNTRLEAALANHSAHVKRGDAGPHVRDIQIALKHLDGLSIAQGELASQTYGPSTAAAVLAYKRKRKIINKSYQSSEDDIVGKMTMAALDEDMFRQQTKGSVVTKPSCTKRGAPGMCFAFDPKPPSGFTLAIARRLGLTDPVA
jgi:peptidoglycan hydrolase-like protein with peptidoglycan-binding domain